MAATPDEGEARTRRSTTARLESGLGPAKLSPKWWREQLIPSFVQAVKHAAERFRPATPTNLIDHLIRGSSHNDRTAQLLYTCYRYFATYVDTKHNPLGDVIWIAGSVDFSPGRSISASLHDLYSILSQADKASLRVCAVNASAASRFELSFYLFPLYFFFSVINQREIASKAVTIFVTRLLQLCWGVDDLGVDIDELLWDPNPTRKLQRPSIAAAKPPHIFGPQKGFKQEWRWLRMCPVYINDFREYVWDPFAKRPDLDALRVVIQPARGEHPQSVSLIASSARVLHRLKATYLASDITAAYPDSKLRIYALLAMIHEVIDVDITNFGDYAAGQVDRVVRHSITTFRHISKLIVGRNSSLEEAHLATIQDAFSQEFPRPLLESQQKLVERFDACAQDFAFLCDELEARASEIDGLVARIKDMMDIGNGRRSQFITLLVSIYVPLAFATSFFGMNLQDKSSDPPGNITWPVWQFWTVATALVVGTLVLPIVAGPVYRSAARFVYRKRRWRTAIVGSISFFCAFLSLYAIIALPAACVILGLYVTLHIIKIIRLRNRQVLQASLYATPVYGMLIGAIGLSYGATDVDSPGGEFALWILGMCLGFVLVLVKPAAFVNPFAVPLHLLDKLEGKKRAQDRQSSGD